MTYNVRYFGHTTRGIASTNSAFQAISRAIALQNPPLDVILLQEVETTSLRSNLLLPRQQPETQLDHLLGTLHQELRAVGHLDIFDGFYFPAHNYSLSSSLSLYTTGLAILVRRPLQVVRHNSEDPFDITHRHLRPSSTPKIEMPGKKPWLKQTRICAHLTLEIEGQTLDIFNTHLSLPSFLEPNFWRRPERMGYGPNQSEEVRKLQEFVDSRRSSDRYLIAGDFNALPGSPVYEQLSQQYYDPLLAREGNVLALKRFATAGFLQLRMHLDHVFTGPGIRWLDLDGSFPFDHPMNPFRGLSDHTPLLGHFSI